MSCDGYEHGSLVILMQAIPEVLVPVGTKGLVVSISRPDHKMDVNFEHFGLFRDLDAHAFQPFTGGDGHSSSGTMFG